LSSYACLTARPPARLPALFVCCGEWVDLLIDRSQTETIHGGANLSFQETFVVPCQGPRDAVVLEVFFVEGSGHGKAQSIGKGGRPHDAMPC